MNTTHVRNPFTGRYEPRAWTLPLVVAVCPSPDCTFHGIAVSVEASDQALWEHVTAVHLPALGASCPSF